MKKESALQYVGWYSAYCAIIGLIVSAICVKPPNDGLAWLLLAFCAVVSLYFICASYYIVIYWDELPPLPEGEPQ